MTFSHITAAKQNLQRHLPETPLLPSPGFSELFSRTVSIKWDNQLMTGSFKERGAVHFLSSVPDLASRGVCAASAGNHALALSYHAAHFGIPCSIVMPRLAPLVKIERTERNGAKILLEGEDFDEAYQRALKLSEESGMVFVPGFDHPYIIAGQGTCGLEILEQSVDFDSVIVPVGGGGLAAGIALAIKTVRPEVFLLGVQSDWVTAPKKLPAEIPQALREKTIADGIAVKTIGKMNRPILDRYLNDLVSVSDSDIALAIVRYLELEKTVVEGAGAAAMAALFAGRLPERYTRPVVLACGSNIDINV
ncbi:MAG: pyridoxal-phosphate dependent enzyme, partial [Bdellovibrionales bacterium]|nr:pyridoxal-phosphate dependent enzyme [Bdellovibrionales bacterium]